MPLFKRVKAGLHTAQVGDRSFELCKATYDTPYKWTLNENTVDKTYLIDSLIATVAEGERALGFVLSVNEMMEGFGAIEGGRYRWMLQTRLGILNIMPGAHHVFMKFDSVEAAKVGLSRQDHFNIYSGKWNMHWNRGTNNAVMLMDLSCQLNRVLPKKDERAS